MHRTTLLSTALGAALLAAPVLIHPAAANDDNCGGQYTMAGHIPGHTPAIVLAQAGGGSGSLSESSPGSPGAGSAGSTPRSLNPSPQQPGQGSALQGVPTRQEGASAPGTLTPVPGVTNAPGTLGGGSSDIQPGTSGGRGTPSRP